MHMSLDVNFSAMRYINSHFTHLKGSAGKTPLQNRWQKVKRILRLHNVANAGCKTAFQLFISLRLYQPSLTFNSLGGC